jgi:hypothetical protein
MLPQSVPRADGKSQMEVLAGQLQPLLIDPARRGAQSTFERIQQSAATLTDKQRQDIRQWLAHEPKAVPAIPLFAAATEPALRALAPAGILGMPTPENRGLLEHLLVDTDPQVKQEAASAAQALRDLAATPSKSFAAIPPTP